MSNTLPKHLNPDATDGVLDAVWDERGKQDAKWGEQNPPDGTGKPTTREFANTARAICESHAANGTVTWKHILDEEVCEAFAETDPRKLRAELVQVAAVAVAWVEAIDRRPAEVDEDDFSWMNGSQSPAAGSSIDTDAANQLPAGSIVLIDTDDMRSRGIVFAGDYPQPLTKFDTGWRMGDQRFDALGMSCRWTVLYVPTSDL